MELVEGREGSSSAPPRDNVYVAVGSKVKQNQKNLEWALEEFGAADFFILHIHSPSITMPSPTGRKFPCSSASEQKVKEFRMEERKKMEEAIQQYMAICAAHKVNVDTLVLESTDISRGIVELVARFSIKVLVIGPAADSKFNKRNFSAKLLMVLIIYREDFHQFRYSCVDQENVGACLPQGTEMTFLGKMALLSWKNDELEKENTSLRAREEKMLKESRRAAFLSTENEVLHRKVLELIDINHLLHRQIDEAIQAQKQLQEAQLAFANIDKGIPVIANYLQFTLTELEEATNGFDQENRIGQGCFGMVYKGKLRHTMVAIKRLNPETTHGEAQFNKEIEALTRVRHPNLVTLIGACPEDQCLVYEFVENGSLEDRLFVRDGEGPLSCRDRLRIAAEICLALLFLHSARPQPIVHGDLKPANILLDANNKAKISDFGICCFLSEPQRESIDTVLKLTNPKGTLLGYMDPFMATKELTFKSDVYAFGIILLQLLTGKSEFGLVKMVETALNNKALYSILDHSAGKWSVNEAAKLSSMGLQCCETNRRCRPNLKTQVWGLLEGYL